MKNKNFIWLVILLVFLVGCKNIQQEKSQEKNYIEIHENESVFLQEGGITINISDTMNHCNRMSIGEIVLCGTKQSLEECWKYKKDNFVGKVNLRRACCVYLNNNSELCCDDYATGYLTEKDGEEMIAFKDYVYRCYFNQR